MLSSTYYSCDDINRPISVDKLVTWKKLQLLFEDHFKMNSKFKSIISYEIVWKYLKFLGVTHLRPFKTQGVIELNLIYMTPNYSNFFVI